MSAVTAARPAATGIARTLLVGLVAGLLAGIANLLLRFVTGALFALPFLVPMGAPGMPATPLPPVAIIIACLVPALAGSLLYWALGRFTRRGATNFVVVAVLFALLSLGGPLSLPIDLGTRLALALMHLVAASIVVTGLLRYAPQR